MEGTEQIKRIVEEYLEIENLAEDDLYIDMQLGFDWDSEEYEVEYCIKPIGEPEGTVSPLRYSSREEALKEYSEQLDAVQQEFPEATILAADPGDYDAKIGGGNPIAGHSDLREP